MVIFAALPIVLYGQFESADRKTRDLVARSIQHRSWLIAQALAPILDRPESPPSESLNGQLRKYAEDGTILKLMFQPSAAGGGGKFYYVASAPQIGSDQLGPELDGLAKHGILQRLSQSCSWDEPIEVRDNQPDGTEEVLTSVIPIRSRWGCWVLISAHTTSEFLNTSIGRPYWQTREVRIAALIYLILALLSVLLALSVRRSLGQFREVAREIRQGRPGEHPFAERNIVPELSSVAADFDQLVQDLHRIAGEIRQAAEDNAHSYKAPLATIQSSLEPLRRLIPSDNGRALRAVELIDSSLSRLRALVCAAQRLDNNTADLIETPRERMNFTKVIAEVLLRYREVMATRGLRLVRRLDENVAVHAGRGVLEVVVENILDNAISFSPKGGAITVSLSRGGGSLDLRIEDEGPGIDPKKIERIFDRYFSLRPRAAGQAPEPAEDAAPEHSGLGLWIVRRNVEALGGRVAAANRVGGGLSIHVTLPISES